MKYTRNLLLLCITAFTLTLSYAEKVDKLMEVMNVKNQMDSGFDAMLPIIEQQAAAMQLDEAQVEELKAIYLNWWENDIDQQKLIDSMKAQYKAAFTEEEMQALIDFYQTPVGKKVLKETPRLMQEQAQIGMEEATSKQQLLMEKLQPFLEKAGQ